MTVFGVSLLDLLLLTFCFAVPFAVLALVVTVLYRWDRRRTPPEAANIAGDVPRRYLRGGSLRRPANVQSSDADAEPTSRPD